MKTSGSRRIAERYVKALFDVAASAEALDAVEKDLLSLAKALEQNMDFRHFLGNPLLSRDNRAQGMVPVLKKMKAHELTCQFIALLAHHRRLTLLGEIVTLFAEKLAGQRGEMAAELVAAAKLKPQEAKQIGEMIGRAYGKQVELSLRHDPALLGGVLIKIGSRQLDGSLAGKLARLKNALQAA